MNEKETIVFSVYQYAYGGKEVKYPAVSYGAFDPRGSRQMRASSHLARCFAGINENELIRYMKRNQIVLGSGQMVISGRVCEDLKVGDVLVTQKGTHIYVKGFHAYGAEFDFMPAGMTCALFTDSINEKLTLNQSMYFAK